VTSVAAAASTRRCGTGGCTSARSRETAATSVTPPASRVVASSRILSDAEVAVVANTSTTEPFKGFVLQDADLNRPARRMSVRFSNRGTQGDTAVRLVRTGGSSAVRR